jgi:hypothetical protein
MKPTSMKTEGPTMNPLPSTGPFIPLSDVAAYSTAVRHFLDGQPDVPIPVWVADRPDLVSSVAAANRLYIASLCPEPVDDGVLLGADDLPEAVVNMVRPLARTWLGAETLAHEADCWRGRSLLVVGSYSQLRLDPIRALLLGLYRVGDRRLSVISGRDAASVGWNAAKQFARLDPMVTDLGLFTDVDRPPRTHGVRVFDDRDFERSDIQAEILQRRWQRVVFQGHGKDDSINLGEFTICGRNMIAGRVPGKLGPRCAYGLPCYKPEDKLVPLNEVSAAEVVLSACNSGPLADLALYDPKYQLLLNALDGPSQTVVVAVSVHDSDRPENVAWMQAARVGADTVDTLNASLAGSHPYPAFLRFGLPDPAGPPAADQIADLTPDELVLTAGRRLNALLSGDLLPPNHRMRPRLTKLAKKIDLWIARPTSQAGDPPAEIRRSLEADLQSLDYEIARQVSDNPETEIMNYPAYFGDRSQLDPDVHVMTCNCGRPAQRFARRGLLPYILDTICVVCMRCGDVSFQLPGAPELLVDAADEVPQGAELEIRLRLRAVRRGPVQLGVFLPSYLREDGFIERPLTRIKADPDKERKVELRIRFADRVPPQAYYFTVFAVQDLAVSTTRRHFGVVPASSVPGN